MTLDQDQDFHIILWALGVIVSMVGAIAGFFIRHINTCTSRASRISEALNKIHEGTTVGAQVALAEIKAKAYEAVSTAALEAQRVRFELAEYKALAKDSFASSQQLREVEERINMHLLNIERKFDEFTHEARQHGSAVAN